MSEAKNEKQKVPPGFKHVGSTKDHEVYEHANGHLLHMKRMAEGGFVDAIWDNFTKPEPPINKNNQVNRDPDKKKAADFTKGFTGRAPASVQNKADGGEILPQALLDPVNNPGEGVDNLPQPMTPYDQKMAERDAFMQNQQAGIEAASKDSLQPASATGATLEQPGFSPTIPQSTPQMHKPQVAPSLMNPLESAMATQQAGIMNEARAQGDLGTEQAKLAAKNTENLQQLQADTQQHLSSIDNDLKATYADIKNGHIDPNHYVNSMETPAKVATVIGLILGGYGAGLAGGPNHALEFLNKQIDRDVDAQKANLANKHNLFSANMQLYKNTQDAANMTRMQYAQIYGSQLEEAAAKSKDPMAIARAQQAIGQMKAQYAPTAMQMAYRQALVQGAQSGRVEASQAASELVPEPQRAKAFEELEKTQDKNQAATHLKTVMERIAKLQTLGNRVGSPFQSANEIEALNTALFSKAKSIFGKTSDQEVSILEHNNKIKVSDDQATVKRKIDAMLGMMGEGSSTPVLDAYLKPYGINNYGYKPPAVLNKAKGF